MLKLSVENKINSQESVKVSATITNLCVVISPNEQAVQTTAVVCGCHLPHICLPSKFQSVLWLCPPITVYVFVSLSWFKH